MSNVEREKSIEAQMQDTRARFRTYIEDRSSPIANQQNVAPDTITSGEWEVQDPTNEIVANLLMVDTSFAANEPVNPEEGVTFGLDFRWDGEPQKACLLYGDQFVIIDQDGFSFPDDGIVADLLTQLEALEDSGHMTRLI